METLRRLTVNTLATTALTLVTLALIALAMGGSALLLHTVFECLAANLLIHAGLPLVRMLESRYVLAELLLEIGYVLLVLLAFGFAFGWYSSTPVWMVVCMGVGIYLVGSAINIMKLNRDVEDINEGLKNLRE